MKTPTGLSDPEGLANLVVSFLFETGSAMLAIGRFPPLPITGDSAYAEVKCEGRHSP
jgi:hypothetical protein